MVKKKSIFEASLVMILISVFCAALLINTLSIKEVIEQPIKQRDKSWRDMGDESPTGDESGFLMYYNYPNQGDPGTAYATNLSTGNAYEYQATIDSEATGETPYLTATDFVVKLVVNDTVGYNTSSSTWETSWIFMNISVDFDWSTDVSWTSMTLVEITSNDNFAWYNCYINNAGAGYQYAKNEDAQQNLNGSLYW